MTAAHPPAPWRLAGPAAVVAVPVPLAAARAVSPPALRVLSLAPGRTLGAVVLARYEGPSTLHYSELVVCAGLVLGDGGRPGLLVSHIAVDLPASVSGGRDIWNLPKVLADFRWSAGGVTVRLDGQVLLGAALPRPRRRLALPLLAPIWGAAGAPPVHTLAPGVLRGAAGRARLDVPRHSPLAPLRLPHRAPAVAGHADLRFPAPGATAAPQAQ